MDISISAATREIKPMQKISVIIPTYNREIFVVKAIDSVLNQSYTDYEIIVVDDGSTDDTRKALEAYANKISYIYQENSGVGSARNTGIKAAQGEWVAFLDSDDEWTKDYLSSQMEQAKKYPHAVAHTTNVAKFSLDGMRSNHFSERNFLDKFKDRPCLVFERPLRVILTHELWWIQSSILRRDILLQAGLFDTRLSIAEDLDVIARVALRGAFTFCRKELVEIFRREETIENLVAQSLKKGINYYKSFGKVIDSLLSTHELTWMEKATISRIMSNHLRALGNVLVMAGKVFEARQSYKKSFSRYPSVQSLIKFAATFLPLTISRNLVRKGRHIQPGEDTNTEAN